MAIEDKKLDRRILRTRRRLRQALLDLIREKEYNDITITDLTERADMRRATFYMHYATVHELLMDALQDLFDEFVQQMEATQTYHPFYVDAERPHIEPVFDYVADHVDLYRPLLTGQAGLLVQQYVRQYLAAIKQRDLAQAGIALDDMPVDLLVNFIAGAEVSMLVWWLQHDMPYSPAQVAQQLQRLLMTGVKPVIG